MRRYLTAAGLALIIHAGAPAFGQDAAPADQAAAATAERIVDQVLSGTDAPAAALVVVGPDGPLVIRADGLRRAGSTDNVAAGDAWHVGSNAKAMTATLAQVLAEADEIDLDDSVRDVLGQAYRAHPAWSDVTLRDLLRHRGGVAPNVGRLTQARLMVWGAEDETGAAGDRRGVIEGLLAQPPMGELGTFDYSNLGYTLAGEMLQTAAGVPFETLIRERLFVPLGMEGVVFGGPDGPGTIRGHTGAPPAPRPGGFDNPLFMSPAGTISLPAEAYAAFLADQLRGQMGLPALLPPSRYAAMAQVPDGGTYGLGWGVRPDGTMAHSGSNTAWFATAMIDLEAGRAVAVLTNYGGASELWPYVEEAMGTFDAGSRP